MEFGAYPAYRFLSYCRLLYFNKYSYRRGIPYYLKPINNRYPQASNANNLGHNPHNLRYQGYTTSNFRLHHKLRLLATYSDNQDCR